MKLHDMWLPDLYTWLMVGLIVLLVVAYLVWTHRLFSKATHYVEHGMETDPYLEYVRKARDDAGSSISVVITVNCIDGKAKRFYYHEGSETRFRITDDGVLYLDM